MLLEIHKLGPEPLAIDRSLGLPAVTDARGRAVLAGPARVRATATRVSGGVELAGRADGMLRLDCSRCLEEFDAPVACSFRLKLVAEAVEYGSGDSRLDERDVDVVYAREGKVDLRAIVAEQIQLELPLKPVCEPGCRGLCPTCGANRNRIECGCRRDVDDPRLAPLREIRKRLGGE